MQRAAMRLYVLDNIGCKGRMTRLRNGATGDGQTEGGQRVGIGDVERIRLLVDLDARKMSCEYSLAGIKVEPGNNRCDRTSTAAKADHQIIHFFEVVHSIRGCIERTIWFQHASNLSDSSIHIAGIVEHMTGNDHIKSMGGKRNIFNVNLLKVKC